MRKVGRNPTVANRGPEDREVARGWVVSAGHADQSSGRRSSATSRFVDRRGTTVRLRAEGRVAPPVRARWGCS
ncbi:hypothetical protein ACFPM0_20260 [Pseudonocardia sulfidoxydans]|uniref:hypothetical protein n=1 Tax=Pseudonocardia sulfidoxydans TaxID=54011 RepID=UPI00360B6A11